MTQAEKDSAALLIANAPKTYLDRIITIETLRDKALNDSRFAASFNGVNSLKPGQILTFPKDVQFTEDFFGVDKKSFFNVVTVDGIEIAVGQFTKKDYTNTPINPALGTLGYEALAAMLSGRTITVQKVISNQPNFETIKGQSVRVSDLSRLYSPKSVNYFVVAGVQEALIID